MELEHPPSTPTKRCPTCRRFKPLNDFPRNRSTKDGRATYCKPCHNQRTKEIAKRLYGGSANFLRQRRYGVSADEVAEMVRQQGGMCAVCCANPAVHVDRDHATGRVRGILCFVCNRGLGKASDSIEVLKANDRLPPGALPMKYVLFSESGPDLGPRAAAPNRPRKA